MHGAFLCKDGAYTAASMKLNYHDSYDAKYYYL